MPHTTYGLLKAIRSHQISSPAVKESLEVGRPNACNLCHLDKSLGWTAQHLSGWYGQNKVKMSDEQENLAAAILWVLKGDAGQRALLAWHMGWPPAKEISSEQWLAPFLATLLEDPYSAVRYVARRSLKRLPGFEAFEFDFAGPAELRAKARRAAMEIWQSGAKVESSRRGDALLLDAAGNLKQETLARLLKQRDDRSMDLQE
jgi:hypothetical protein